MTNDELLSVVTSRIGGPIDDIDTSIDRVIRFNFDGKRYRVCQTPNGFFVEESKDGILTTNQETTAIERKLNGQVFMPEYKESLEKLIEFAREIAPGNEELTPHVESCEKLLQEMLKGKSLLQLS